MSELENGIEILVYVTTRKSCHSQGYCVGICAVHGRYGFECLSSVKHKAMGLLIERVRSGHSGRDTYIIGTIKYKNLKDDVPDDVISKHIMGIYNREGKERLESEPVNVDNIISLPNNRFQISETQGLGNNKLYSTIFSTINRRTGNDSDIHKKYGTRIALRVTMLLESKEIMNNTINDMMNGCITTGTKYIQLLIEHLGSDVSCLTSEITIIATRISEMLVENDLIRPSDVYMDTGSIVKLLGIFKRSIENGNLSLDKVYDILFSIGYIKTSKGAIMNVIGSLEDYLILREFKANGHL